MEIIKRLLRFLGRITWRVGRVPEQFSSELQAREWFLRYGLSSLVIAFIFLGWEATFAPGSKLQAGLAQLTTGHDLAVQAGGFGLLLALVVSRVLIAVFLLGIVLTVFRMFLHRRDST